jgi:hypothetical protein
MGDLQTSEDYALYVADGLEGEIGVVVVEGSIQACDQKVSAGNMLVSKIANQCAMTVEKGSRLLLFGGNPFPEERHIFWNFVSSDRNKIEAAKQRWKDWDFPKVAGDDTYVPLPDEMSANLKRKT